MVAICHLQVCKVLRKLNRCDYYPISSFFLILKSRTEVALEASSTYTMIKCSITDAIGDVYAWKAMKEDNFVYLLAYRVREELLF